MTLTQYYDRLSRHDWFWTYADDHRGYWEGKDAEDELIRQGHASPEHAALFKAFRAHKFESAEKPERPADDARAA